MLYKRLIINGTEYLLAVSQAGSGAPAAATPGSLGILYMDIDTGDLYKCTGGEDGVWEWEQLGEGGSGYKLPIGGDQLGGVKNGGNVIINEDGTMTAPEAGSGGNGDDGFSPIATVTQTDSGATITITDKNGTTTATVNNGKDGQDGQDGYTPVKGVDYFDGEDGQDGSPGKDGADGQPGKDGTSPVVSVSAITGGHRITITDADGTKTVDVMDGSDGKNGADGSDGKDGNGIKSAVLNADYTLTLTFDDGTSYTTPSIRGATGATGSAGKDGQNGSNGADGVGIASIEQTTTSTADGGNNVFTVTLTNGNKATFTVKNGSTGSTGATGAAGKDGKDGADGKTPVKGTDYFTDSDITEIVNAVYAKIADGNEVAY